ncbi:MULTISPECIES: tetratricopeptide repeat protein [unclassified Roseburia]|jgi:hypothetical protein|uniref:tetratricopeptide repeat protein n=1 Tax=unclassified Roseburia TaxID=2637578 RepID=UPI000E521925|nr:MULTISPECIES: tetratricopeptide repeat protein [unclassified Roseburia]RHQ40697.1 hypothetical protein DWY43_12390 [Roseburia sp. AF25-18LB]RHQ47172.1 hypothetical protein DWY39_10970 [Roseburia sp. AF25-15LB]RHQ47384.1 hypothetical protein DWY37_11685 [Roseburia sp. AF25-13LB]
MNNKDLFVFKFVDREIERKIVRNFLLDSNTENILWIHGESGVGKTELIKYFMSCFPYKFIHVNPIKKQITSYFSLFIRELEKQNTSLAGFIFKNYKKIKNISNNTISDINIKTKILMGILEIGESIFIDAKDDFFSTANVLGQYIQYISKKEKYIFVFDNFQQCDTKSLERIQEITQNLWGKENIKFIFITTDHTISSDSEIIKFLLEKNSLISISIEPFDNKDFFLDILLNIYTLDGITTTEMDQLYEACNGIPEKLKNFLRNMYLADGIEYYKDSSQARLIPGKFKDVLCKGVDSTDLEALNLLEKLVFNIIICWNDSMPLSLLNEISQYIAGEVLYLPSELKSQIMASIYNLFSLNILELCENRVRVKHDLVYLSFLPKYAAIPEAILYSKLYEYINSNKKQVVDMYSQSFFDLNNALYSYKADIQSWQQINLDCLKILVEQKDYKNISIIISRLERSLTCFETSDLLFLAECFYNCGKYDKARNILNYTHKKLNSDKNYFQYYYLSGKIFNMMMDKESAEKELILSQKYILPQSEEEILVKHMLQLILVEVVGRKDEAKEIFYSISKHLDKYPENSQALATLLKNCSNYYTGKQALSLLKKALEISEKNNDLVEIAFIKNNMGYEQFKLNNYEKCRTLYKESINILQQTKIHESAYPLSNLAVCHMINQEYDEAIALINRAFFWNCSNYLEYVLNTHLMLCYEQIGKNNESYKIAKCLLDKLESGKINDPVILRKVYLNLAINFDKLQIESYAKECAEKAYVFSTNTSSEYRAAKIYEKYGGRPTKDLSTLQNQYCTKYYFDHWLTIFSHD